MRVTLLGLRWSLKFLGAADIGRDRHGECDSPDTPRREIRILQSLKGATLLETLLHEMLHACCFHLSEDWVRNTSEHLAWLLRCYGWHREDAVGRSARWDRSRLAGILVATIFHFLRGANFQYERDDWSLRAAEDMSRVLWRLNYRPHEDFEPEDVT